MIPAIYKNKKLQEGHRISLEPSYGHLPEIPYHTLLQKVRGWVERFL
jgi:hypothetical protein